MVKGTETVELITENARDRARHHLNDGWCFASPGAGGAQVHSETANMGAP
jgi:hypothetical protein